MLLSNRHYQRDFDVISLCITLCINALGLLCIYSATYQPHEPYSLFFKKQAVGIIFGSIIYVFFCFADHRTLIRWGYFGYWVVLGLLFFTLIKGSIGMGGQRWLNIGFAKFQPSELAKLLLPPFISHTYATHNTKSAITFKESIPILTILMISFLVIRKQPDLGTAIIILAAGLIMLWFAGLSKKFYIGSFTIILLTTPILWQLLKPYQRQRIFVFLGYGSLQKERYHIEQSKIAIGSGGLQGKGFLHGTQNRLLFLPESHTDSIFAVFAEEMGFAGVLLLLLLYWLLFKRLLRVVSESGSPAIQILTLGLSIHIILSTIINLAMIVDFLPIVGIPLPMMSYGISNLWVTLASLGWIQGLAMRKFYLSKQT